TIAPSSLTVEPARTERLLEVRDLKTHFFTRKGVAKVLDGLSFHVGKGEIVGLVGESGSGKSVTGFSIVQLLKHPGRIVGGEVVFEGRDLTKLSEEEIQEIRGKQVSMIFQNPRSSLNPVISIGEQISQVLRYRRGMSKSEAWQAAIDLLRTVHIPEPERRMRSFPHQMSGGMAQRVMIAMAISCSPKLLIADEPTTGLDVTIEYQIIQLLKEMRDLTGTSVIVITHDLNMAAEVCDRIMVMYAGRIVEEAPIKDFFTTPRHPYTVGLLASRPSLAVDADIPTIPGNVPDLIMRPSGCPFHPRCRWATDVCREQDPAFREIAPAHFAACHHVEEVARDVIAAR
ncbi:MAG: oligopeptide transport system ATP-binding protein, partial [Thermomicrobiales bacterium]|nr:oligopeptide transport system ATP-binding protein [Thermomicrobiales bacterium]